MKLSTILPLASLFLSAAASPHFERPSIHQNANALITRQTSSTARCGIKGWDTGLTVAYWYGNDTSLTNQKACGEKCAVDAKCKSFAHNTLACLLYDKSVVDTLREDATSDYTFYDSGCGEVPVTPSSSAVADVPKSSKAPSPESTPVPTAHPSSAYEAHPTVTPSSVPSAPHHSETPAPSHATPNQSYSHPSGPKPTRKPHACRAHKRTRARRS